MNKPFYSVALLAAALLAGTIQADAQTVTKVKTKTSKSAKATAADLTTPPPPPGEAGGPEGRDGHRGPHRGPHGKGGPRGEHGPRGERGGLQTITEVRGTLSTYLANNDEQVYDAFVLRPEGTAAPDTIRFPRHLGQQLLAAAKAGSPVTVSGVRHSGPNGRSHFRFVSLASGSQTVNDAPPARPATPPTPETTTAKGTIKELRRDPKGHIRGLVLSDQTVVQLPPHAIEQLADKLTVGATVEAAGNLRTARPGEARATTAAPVRVVHAQTLALGGTKYLVR